MVSTWNKAIELEQTAINAPGESVTLETIASDYQSNEIAANQRWHGKKVRFTARVARVSADNLILFNIGRFSAEASFSVIASNRLAKINAADDVTLDCYGNGVSGFTLYFTACRTVSP